MNHGNAQIIFQFENRDHAYDGGLPYEVLDRCAHLLNENGLWLGGYPPELQTKAREPRDMLPVALWEIEHVGGWVVRIEGARASGAIFEEDWKNPRIY